MAASTHAGLMVGRERVTVRVLTLLVVVVVAHVSCGGGSRRITRPPADPPAASQPDGPRSEFEGEWRLVGFESTGGARKVSGFLRYDRFATITVHAELAADEPSARPPRTVLADFTAKAAPAGGEFEYVGLRMGVDSDRLTEDAVRMDEWRHYELSGDTLRLSVRGGGGQPGATLIFQRGM
jgi:hypothetical protein